MKFTGNQIDFQLLNDYQITAEFCDETITSDAGILLLREIDKKLGLNERLAEVTPDKRDPNRITHTMQSMIQQRIFGLALGYEDLNNHDSLLVSYLRPSNIEPTKHALAISTVC